MPHFINPFTDVGFKKIFGQEVTKDLLIDFFERLIGRRKSDKGHQVSRQRTNA